MDCKGKRVLVMGRGVSGSGAARVYSALGADITIRTGKCGLRPDDDFDIVVVSPGLPPDHPIFGDATKKNISIMSDIALGAELCTAPVIGVTGTNGKTTTVGMLGEIYREAGIKASVCGNIGISFAEEAYGGGFDRAILELSSFQLLHASPLRCHIACILNITPDHLDYHGTFSAYRAAKLKIADGQTPSDYLLAPADLDIAGISGKPEVLRAGTDFYADEYLVVAGKKIMPVGALAAKGKHNTDNALFAAAAAYADGVDEDAIASALARFRTGAHRISEVGEINGTVFYDDSKGTNPAATLAAARCMNGRTALIAGGSDKDCDFTDMFASLPANVEGIFLTGANAEKMAAAARAAGREATVFDGLRECVERCGRGEYDSVLFSPASASFDRYNGYAERGMAFGREVSRLVSGADGKTE